MRCSNTRRSALSGVRAAQWADSLDRALTIFGSSARRAELLRRAVTGERRRYVAVTTPTGGVRLNHPIWPRQRKLKVPRKRVDVTPVKQASAGGLRCADPGRALT